jgi:hypothetical protein
MRIPIILDVLVTHLSYTIFQVKTGTPCLSQGESLLIYQPFILSHKAGQLLRNHLFMIFCP